MLSIAADGTISVKGTHTYASPGKYAIKVSIQDQGGAALVVNPNAFIGTTNQRFVAKAYLDVLGRAVDANALTFWTNALDKGQIDQKETIGLLRARGQLRAYGGRWSEAATDFSKAVELEPNNQKPATS